MLAITSTSVDENGLPDVIPSGASPPQADGEAGSHAPLQMPRPPQAGWLGMTFSYK